MQIYVPPPRQFRGLGARAGSGSGSSSDVNRGTTRDSGGAGDWRSGFKAIVQNAVVADPAPGKPSIDDLLTDPPSAFDAVLESEIVPLVNKFKRGTVVSESRSDSKLYKLTFDDKGFFTGFADVTPTGVNPEEVAYLNAITKAGKWAMKAAYDEMAAFSGKTDSRSKGRYALARDAYDSWFSAFVPAALAKFAAFRNKRKNWESNLTKYSTEAIGIPDTIDSVSKLNTLTQKVQTAVDGLDVSGAQAKPLLQSLASRLTQLGKKVTASEADDALVASAETMELSALANAVTTATTLGKSGLATRLKAVYDRRKKAADDAKKIQDEADQKAKDDAEALKKLQEESDAKLKTLEAEAAATKKTLEEEAAATKKNLIIGGVVALGVILLLVSRK
jgi:hypothetical protein